MGKANCYPKYVIILSFFLFFFLSFFLSFFIFFFIIIIIDNFQGYDPHVPWFREFPFIVWVQTCKLKYADFLKKPKSDLAQETYDCIKVIIILLLLIINIIIIIIIFIMCMFFYVL